MSFTAEPMRISPHHTVDDWKALTFSAEKDWQKAVDIFEDRIYGRFLEVINLIEGYEFSGFAILAMDCLLMETLQQFHEGARRTPHRKSQDYFARFLTRTSFSKFFNQRLAEEFYKQIRCGILHQAEIGGNSRVLIRPEVPLVSWTKDEKSLLINRRLFHGQLAKVYRSYVSQLRKNNPPNAELRSNFKKKMDYICRV